MNSPGLALLGSTRELGRRAQVRPLDHVLWTPPQLALLKNLETRCLLRTGNQFGKTWAALAEAIFWATGKHPYKRLPFKPPVEILVVCASWSQSIAIQGKLWALLPKDEITEDTVFDPIRGFRGGVTPVVTFRNGSRIRIKTSQQGGLSLSGSTVHLVIGDEPFKSSRIYAEIERRLTRTGGWLILSLTPVNAPTDWLRDLAREGKIVDLHFSMEPENFIPVGSTRPLRTEAGDLMDAAWIADQRDSVLSWEAPVVLDGEWEFRAVDRLFENFKPDKHAIPNLLRSQVKPRGEVQLALGIDYGEDKLRTVAVLVAVDTSGEHPRVWVLGEYVPTAPSTMDMDAEAILGLLGSLGLKWSDLDWAYGDKRYTDGRGQITRKSNGLMLRALEKASKTEQGLRPKIRGAKRGKGAGRGAVMAGVRWLNDAQIRPGHFYVDQARCSWLTECLNKWDGTERSKHKDAVDALRYALTPLILRHGPRGPAPVVRLH